MVPRKILTRSSPISLNAARQSHLNVVCFYCSRQVNTARPKAVINVVRTNRVNDVKASACWVWKPIKPNSALISLKRYDNVDVRGRSRSQDIYHTYGNSKPLLKDKDGEEVDVHMYRSMTGSLMYLTSSRADIMFAMCACTRYQVNPKVSHLHVMKRIFRYLKGKPKLGLWYLKDSPFDLVAYTNSDYAGASLDRKSTIGGCQFLRCRLISWQCKKQTVVANSIIGAEYVAASSCCR
nr:uncharacterized mitochondrial protein AtMg00810-like [Tanacetum cinerariifolium]